MDSQCKSQLGNITSNVLYGAATLAYTNTALLSGALYEAALNHTC